MIPSKQKYLARVLDFVARQQTKALYAKLSPIHVVAKEKILVLRWETSTLKQSKQIRKLPVTDTSK